jgi:hypothetical protein
LTPDEIVLELAAAGTRSVPAAAVRRRLRELKGADVRLAEIERSVWIQFQDDLADLEEAQLRLVDLEDYAYLLTNEAKAEQRTSDGRFPAPDLEKAQASVSRRMDLILRKNKLFQFVLSEAVKRREKELRLQILADGRRPPPGRMAVDAISSRTPAPQLPPTDGRTDVVTASSSHCEAPAPAGVSHVSATHSS